jgi:phosphatidylglycerol---prolipoprotein diacylglyceryl transferase
MHPEICQIGPLTIYSYGLMLVIAFLTSSFLLEQQARKEGFDGSVIFNLVFMAFVFGVAGSRLFYVVENSGYYLKAPLEIFMLQRGGLSWFGGFISGSLFAVAYSRAKGLSAYKTLDLIAPFLALAQSIGRVGCFLNGCCFGKESVFGVYFPVHDKVLIPTQVYSSLILLCIFLFLRFRQGLKHKDGAIFFTYLLLYSLQRFFIEFWRADNPVVFFGLTLFQLLSILAFVISLIQLVNIRAGKKVS